MTEPIVSSYLPRSGTLTLEFALSRHLAKRAADEVLHRVGLRGIHRAIAQF
jgi:hypothetical protein